VLRRTFGPKCDEINGMGNEPKSNVTVLQCECMKRDEIGRTCSITKKINTNL
jgi:hypothetical protein